MNVVPESAIMRFQSSVAFALALLFMSPMGALTSPVSEKPSPPPGNGPQAVSDNLLEDVGNALGSVFGPLAPSNGKTGGHGA
jgi:hypothetical protein